MVIDGSKRIVFDKGEGKMPAKKKKSVATKLIGFALVIAVVFFSAKNRLLDSDHQSRPRIGESPMLNVAVPVDRSQLSELILPSPPGFFSLAETEDRGYLDPTLESEPTAEVDEVSHTGPSPYEQKLEDQKAWGSQPRHASLTSPKQKVQTSTTTSVATSQSPILPGHEDPHLWYESQFLETAVTIDVPEDEQVATDGSIEFQALPVLSGDYASGASTFADHFPTKIMPAAATAPIAATDGSWAASSTQSTVPARTAATTRSWESGRY